jgi:hypothetical protein
MMTTAETNETAATSAAQGATVAPEKATSKKAAKRTKGAPQSQKTASSAQRRKGAKTGKKAVSRAAGNTQSKGAKILEMIGRARGATLAEIMAAAGWQAHSVRGFISTASKKHSVKIESMKSEAGDRAYRITK